ncbi:MAG: hypothetical protein ACEPOV_13740 [Hyphomicrobiales bacterium]
MKDLQEIWNTQDIKSINLNNRSTYNHNKETLSYSKHKHKGTVVVLSIWTLILLVFCSLSISFNYYSMNTNILLAIMSLAMIVRLIVEVYSLRKLNQCDYIESPRGFISKMISFYSLRKIIHGLVTYFITVIYIILAIAFVYTIKDYPFIQNFIEVFVGLSLLAAIIIVFFVNKMINKELNSIKKLIDYYEELIKKI